MIIKPRFAISTYTARYGQYIPVRQVTDTRTARNRAVPPKIDHRRSISTVDGRLKKKSIIGGRLRKKKGRRGKEEKKKRRKNTSPAHRPRPHAVAARGSPAATAAFSLAQGDRASPHAGRKIEATSPPLPGDTINWGCFHPVTTRNRPVTFDFDHRQPISGSISRGREKEEEGEEKLGVALLFPRTITWSRTALPPHYPLPAGEESPARFIARGRFLLPAQGEETSPHVGTMNEVT
ncbi:hypothetical protein GW17_00023998 [Ensete ventricosum]|nr:hypothetical protein GW17_00023998 [Ensete ventricosum]